eukprot:gene25023-31429_t
MSCCKQIYFSEGIKGFYKGYFATLAREVPSIGMYFFTYKNLRDQITKYEGNKHDSHSNFATLIAGGLAGATSWGVVYPSDVIKTYMQISTTPVGTDKLAYKDMRIRDVATSLYRRHGGRIFFNGNIQEVFGTPPAIELPDCCEPPLIMKCYLVINNAKFVNEDTRGLGNEFDVDSDPEGVVTSSVKYHLNISSNKKTKF